MHKYHQVLRRRVLDLQKYATVNNFVLAVAAFIALGWLWGSVDALGRNYRYQQQVDDARGQVELLSLQNQNLKAEQSYLNTNEYLELAARSTLNKALPGEKLLILPETAAKRAPVTSSAAAPAESNFAQWLDFLFGKHAEG